MAYFLLLFDPVIIVLHQCSPFGNRSAPGQGMLSFCQTPAQARPGGVHKFYNKVMKNKSSEFILLL